MGDDYTIADIAIFPWVRNLIGFYEAGELVGMADFAHVKRALAAFLARPAVVKGLAIPPRPARPGGGSTPQPSGLTQVNTRTGGTFMNSQQVSGWPR